MADWILTEPAIINEFEVLIRCQLVPAVLYLYENGHVQPTKEHGLLAMVYCNITLTDYICKRVPIFEVPPETQVDIVDRDYCLEMLKYLWEENIVEQFHPSALREACESNQGRIINWLCKSERTAITDPDTKTLAKSIRKSYRQAKEQERINTKIDREINIMKKYLE